MKVLDDVAVGGDDRSVVDALLVVLLCQVAILTVVPLRRAASSCLPACLPAFLPACLPAYVSCLPNIP